MLKKWYVQNFGEFKGTQKIIKALWMLQIPLLIIFFTYDVYIKHYEIAFFDALAILFIYTVNCLDRYSRKIEKEKGKI